MVLPLAIGAAAGGLFSFLGAKKAARAQENAANKQIKFAKSALDADNERFAPYYERGLKADHALAFEHGLADRPEGYRGYEVTPHARDLLEMGRDSIEAGAAGRGGLFSGATVSALDNNRMRVINSDRVRYLSALDRMSTAGQAAAGRQAASGAAYTGQINTALANQGNAQAAGWIGATNAANSTIDNALSVYGYMKAA